MSEARWIGLTGWNQCATRFVDPECISSFSRLSRA